MTGLDSLIKLGIDCKQGVLREYDVSRLLYACSNTQVIDPIKGPANSHKDA